MIKPLLIALLFAAAAIARAEEIPLKTIWSNDHYGGTRLINELEPKPREPIAVLDPKLLAQRDANDQRRLTQIGRKLFTRTPPGPAIVVEGTDRQALQNAHAVFVKNEPQPRFLPANTPLSVFFYSYIGRSVRLMSVERERQRVTIRYAHPSAPPVKPPRVRISTADPTLYYSLIGIGSFPPGQVRVDVEQVPFTTREGISVPVAPPRRLVVCKSCSFLVR